MIFRRLTAFALVLAGAACAAHGPEGASPSPVDVSAVRVARRSLRSTSAFSGTIEPAQSTTVGATASGRIVEMAVRVGDSVAPGQTIARVDAQRYRAAVNEAQAASQAASDSARAAQAAVATAQSRLTLADATAHRMTILYREGAISAQQHDQSTAELASASAALQQAIAQAAAARSSSVQAQAGVQSAFVPLSESTITAPFAGVVTKKFVYAGAVVAEGSPIVTLDGTGAFELDVAVPEDQAGLVHPGMEAPVHVDALGNQMVPARVRAIVASGNASLRSVIVKLVLERHTGLLSGMYASVQFAQRAAPAWVVPVRAVVTRAGQSGVFEIDGHTAAFVPVVTGATNGNDVAVSGITGAGTRVATSNLQLLTDGTPVRVRP